MLVGCESTWDPSNKYLVHTPASGCLSTQNISLTRYCTCACVMHMFRLDLIFPLLIWVNLVNVNPNIVYCNTDVFLRFVAGKRNQETGRSYFCLHLGEHQCFSELLRKKNHLSVYFRGQFLPSFIISCLFYVFLFKVVGIADSHVTVANCPSTYAYLSDLVSFSLFRAFRYPRLWMILTHSWSASNLE